jgi:hypothetical protein
MVHEVCAITRERYDMSKLSKIEQAVNLQLAEDHTELLRLYKELPMRFHEGLAQPQGERVVFFGRYQRFHGYVVKEDDGLVVYWADQNKRGPWAKVANPEYRESLKQFTDWLYDASPSYPEIIGGLEMMQIPRPHRSTEDDCYRVYVRNALMDLQVERHRPVMAGLRVHLCQLLAGTDMVPFKPGDTMETLKERLTEKKRERDYWALLLEWLEKS